MPTNRHPITRARRGHHITAEAVDIFAEMRARRLDRKWWELHARLAKLLHTRPWEFPCVRDPDVASDGPWDASAKARWRELARLLDERDRAA